MGSTTPIPRTFNEDREIILVWPKGHPVAQVERPAGYVSHVLQSSRDEDAWTSIHRQAVPRFAESDLRAWLVRYRQYALPEAILIATESSSGAAVATAGCLCVPDGGSIPGAGQLAWVATVPSHRRRGIAAWLCSIATQRLLSERFENVFVGTGTDMLPAVRVYLALGYIPCIIDDSHRDKWHWIRQETGLVAAPDRWLTREQYLQVEK